jgi:hypothetical protein
MQLQQPPPINVFTLDDEFNAPPTTEAQLPLAVFLNPPPTKLQLDAAQLQKPPTTAE